MEEKDADYFFGRRRETVEVIKALAGAPDEMRWRLPKPAIRLNKLRNGQSLATALATFRRKNSQFCAGK
jgi:hypothetical protein